MTEQPTPSFPTHPNPTGDDDGDELYRDPRTQPALNHAMLEAAEFAHREGWELPPLLFALVPKHLLPGALETELWDDPNPLALVLQEDLPEHILPASAELADYISRLKWEAGIVGAILVQEIRFAETTDAETAPTRPARLLSGVLDNGLVQTLLELRPTEAELATQGPFAEDELQLRGGPGIGKHVIAALQQTFVDGEASAALARDEF